MKTLFFKILTILAAASLCACEDENLPVVPATLVEFQNPSHIIGEHFDESTVVKLALSPAAATPGVVKLRIAKGMQERVQTTPSQVAGLVSIPVTKGARELQFEVRALDNHLLEGSQAVTFSIEASEGLDPGPQDSFLLTIEDDEQEQESPVLSYANFEVQDGMLWENKGSMLEYRIKLLPAVTSPSRIVVRVGGDHPNAFLTNPTNMEGLISLPVAAGASSVTFSIAAVDNVVYDGHKQLELEIVGTEGSVEKGSIIAQSLVIKDDELTGKLQGYEVIGPEGSEKRSYFYDLEGRISQIITEQKAPHHSTQQTDSYSYDGEGRVTRVNKWPGRDVVYSWDDGHIVKAEVYQDEILIQYAHYDYDDRENLVGVEPYYRQGDGSMKMSGVTVYLYFEDDNVYKSLTYNNPGDGQEPELLVTRTYENYLEADAPLSMFEVLPTVRFQKQLPGSYRYENHSSGQDMGYDLTYEFDEGGLVQQRIASAPGDRQVTRYFYY